jgi:hypothetical protein
MSNFRQVDRQTGFLLPPSVDEWLPERHLARFVVEVIEGLDQRALSGSYRGSGSASYPRRCCWACWFMAMRRGCFRAGSWSGRRMLRWRFASSRRMTILTTTRSQLLSLSKGRRRFVKEIAGLFVKVLVLAREMGVLKLGTMALDGTKIHTNARPAQRAFL